MAPIFLMPLDLITFRRGCCSVTAVKASTTSLSRELKGLGDTVRLMPPGVTFKQWIKANR
jgi:hypothetical protein